MCPSIMSFNALDASLKLVADISRCDKANLVVYAKDIECWKSLQYPKRVSNMSLSLYHLILTLTILSEQRTAHKFRQDMVCPLRLIDNWLWPLKRKSSLRS